MQLFDILFFFPLIIFQRKKKKRMSCLAQNRVKFLSEDFNWITTIRLHSIRHWYCILVRVPNLVAPRTEKVSRMTSALQKQISHRFDVYRLINFCMLKKKVNFQMNVFPIHCLSATERQVNLCYRCLMRYWTFTELTFGLCCSYTEWTLGTVSGR